MHAACSFGRTCDNRQEKWPFPECEGSNPQVCCKTTQHHPAVPRSVLLITGAVVTRGVSCAPAQSARAASTSGGTQGRCQGRAAAHLDEVRGHRHQLPHGSGCEPHGQLGGQACAQQGQQLNRRRPHQALPEEAHPQPAAFAGAVLLHCRGVVTCTPRPTMQLHAGSNFRTSRV
jgi:hypothetical protein